MTAYRWARNHRFFHAIQANEGNTWIYGCGIGCAVALAILVAVSLASFFFVQRAMEEGGVAFREEGERTYANLKESGKVPEEHEALYDEFMTRVLSPETGLMAIGWGLAALESTLADGVVTDQEAVFIQDFVTFFDANPNAGIIKFMEFMQAHPEFGEIMEESVKLQEELPPAAGNTVVLPPSGEESASTGDAPQDEPEVRDGAPETDENPELPVPTVQD